MTSQGKVESAFGESWASKKERLLGERLQGDSEDGRQALKLHGSSLWPLRDLRCFIVKSNDDLRQEVPTQPNPTSLSRTDPFACALFCVLYIGVLPAADEPLQRDLHRLRAGRAARAAAVQDHQHLEQVRPQPAIHDPRPNPPSLSRAALAWWRC